MQRVSSLFSIGIPSSSSSSTSRDQSHRQGPSTSNPQSKSLDGSSLSRLKYVLENLPSAQKHVFTRNARVEVLAELYEAFWGSFSHLFLPNVTLSLPTHSLLSEVQMRHGFFGAGGEEPIVPGRSCGHIFLKGESCFRCKDCALDDSCVMCSKCFRATNHRDHNVTFYICQQSGGCCDCGDQEAWRIPMKCRFHPPLSTSTSLNQQSNSTNVEQGATSVSTPPTPMDIQGPQHHSDSINRDRQNIPPLLIESMSETTAYVLDYILSTLSVSPCEPSVPSSPEMLRAQPTSDPSSNPKDLFSIILWSSEKHSFEEVVHHITETAGRSPEQATLLVNRLEEQGREIIDMGGYTTRLLEIASTISQIDLGVTVRRAYDTFREQICAVLIEWLLDLTRSRLGPDTEILREIIAKELLSSPRYCITNISTHEKIVEGVANPSRLDWLFLYHPRLWKKPRLNLKEIYVSVLSLSQEHKLTLAVHFANVYPQIIDSYLLIDREAETSIKYFALQLFTVPSVAAHVVKFNGIISRLLSIITAFFTNQIYVLATDDKTQLLAQDKHIIYPPSLDIPIDIDSFPFKSKRFMPVFSDLRYICHNDSVQRLIAHNHSYIKQFADTCQLFMCINPNKRAKSSHVEYETDAWISVFNVTLSLSRVIKVYGEAYNHASTIELLQAIQYVIQCILKVCMLEDPRLDKSKFQPIDFHDVTFGPGNKSFQLVHFDITEGWISFHHSLHWLLAELLKHVELISDEALSLVGLGPFKDVCCEDGAAEPALLTLIDYPLRVLAMIAQIRTGLWVRNGFVIRGQLLHYRDFMLRELCYDQDLFILQSSFIMTSSPDVVLVSILDRFQMLDWFAGGLIHPLYEGPHLSSMVEETLYVLITILSENANASKMSLRRAVRREIVHSLAVGPCTYTDLVKRVAERMVDDVCFDHVLREVTHFRPPESTSDSGIYELKDEVFDEVNPFFYHYTRNKREEVEAILKTRLKKKTGIADPVIVPKPLSISYGPFTILTQVFESPTLLQIMFYSLYNILAYTEALDTTPPSAEAILDQALHLVMLAVVERGASFAQLVLLHSFEKQLLLIDVLSILEIHDKYKTYRPNVSWILGQLEQYIPAEIRSRRRSKNQADGRIEDTEEAKKRAAKARQEAILKKMKAQQTSFAMNLEDLSDDEDDKDMPVAVDEIVNFGTCIVCQEDLDAGKGFGALGLVQPSRLIRKNPDGSIAYLNEAILAPESMDRSPDTLPDLSFPPKDAEARDAVKSNTSSPYDGFPAQHTRFGLRTSVCSHMMHLDCFQVYNISIKQRHRSQGQRNHPEVIARKEYICPLCKSLGNIILPVTVPSTTPLNNVPFSDWNRSAGITILKSKPDPQLDALQFKTGTGEFVFWSAQDSAYVPFSKHPESDGGADWHKMLDTLVVVTKSFSQQTRHLRDRPEPEPGERGAGLYLPEDLVGYTINSIEVADRGNGSPSTLIVDKLSESTLRMIRGLVTDLTNLAALPFKNRPDEGRDAIRQAIIKRLLPEWSRTSLSSLSYPLLLRDPLTILVETAAVAPEVLRHVLVLLYHVSLARTVIGLVYVLNKSRATHTVPIARRQHADIFGDVHMFCRSVVRHSPVFEHTAEMVFDAFGEARVEKLLYTFTLPFLRRAAILCRAVLPSAFPTPVFEADEPCEYNRLLKMLGISPLADLPNQDTLQTALAGWCAHYGHSHAATQLNCGVALDYPAVYRMARLRLVLDSMFGEEDKSLMCHRCRTVPIDAAICLICGTVCCMQSHCCKDTDGQRDRGECNMHTRECGGAIGVYFLVKRCALLYLYAGNGSFAQVPYLDVHGEVDTTMRRGRRQYLHAARWEEIRKTWLNHGIPTLVARKLESTVDSGGWETL